MTLIEATLQKDKAIWITAYQRAEAGRSSVLLQGCKVREG